MAKMQAVELRTLDGGFVTEHNYLDLASNTTIDESNMNVTPRGLRRRRYGLQYEQGTQYIDTGVPYSLEDTPTVTSFLWENVSGYPDATFLVVQFNNRLFVYDTNRDRLSSRRLSSLSGLYILEDETHRKPFDYASVDGDLIIATGTQEIAIVTAEGVAARQDPNAISFSIDSERLLIRDTFGVEVLYTLPYDSDKTVSLQDPRYRGLRPVAVTEDYDPTLVSGFRVQGLKLVEEDRYLPLTISTSNHYARDDYGDGITITPGNNNNYRSYMLENMTIRQSNDKYLIEFDNYSTLETVIIHDLPVGGSKIFTNEIVEEYGDALSWANTFSTEITFTEFEEWKEYIKSGEERVQEVPEDSWPITEDYTYWRQTFDLNIQTPSTTVEPGQLPDSVRVHYYNLRNQTWAEKRYPKTGSVKTDPIDEFFQGTSGLEFPSNADSIYSAYYPNLEEANSTTNRFHGEDLWGNPSGNLPAPKGYFIIDALDRSTSRSEQWAELCKGQIHTIGNEYEYLIDGKSVILPTDITSGGASAIASYAGRLWYGGFSGDGASNDVRLESYLLYSQLSNSRSGYWRCYQENDPTSYDEPDLLATDGGVIPLDGAYGIQRLVQVGNALVVFAQNGVWVVSGEDGNFFTPTSQRVVKLTDKASLSSRSIVVVNNMAYFWALDGIYKVEVSTTGGGSSLSNLTYSTIHSYYTEIDEELLSYVIGVYDPYEGIVSWTWNNTTNREGSTEILRLKVSNNTFSKYKVFDGTNTRTFLGQVEVKPFIAGASTSDIVVSDGTDTPKIVLNGSLSVIYRISEGVTTRPSTVKSMVAHKLNNGNIGLRFADFSNEDFMDWGEVDAEAYFITSYLVGADSQLEKQIPYITTHFERTEEALVDDGDGNYNWATPSGALLSAQWDWSDSSITGKWSKEYDAYRLTRNFIPSGLQDTSGGGYETVVTKSKLRGNGRAVALKYRSKPNADMRFIGFGMMWQSKTRI